MKEKLSISLDTKNIELIEKILEKGIFRSKSHLIEYSLMKFLEKIKQHEEVVF